MTTLAEVQEHQADMLAIQTLAIAGLLDETQQLDDLPPARAAALLREIVAELLDEFGDEAAVEAADFYDEMRAGVAAAAAVSYAAQLATGLSSDEVQDSLGWALAPLFADAPDYDVALDRVSGKLAWLVGMQGRDTIALNAAGDPLGTRYARYASANACAFCRLMATRGAAYRTEESALFVVGEIDPRRGGIRRGPRGTQQAGDKYHDFCKCVAVPVFPGDDYEPAPYVADWYQDYLDAAKAAGGTRRADLSTILAKMRENTGAH